MGGKSVYFPPANQTTHPASQPACLRVCLSRPQEKRQPPVKTKASLNSGPSSDKLARGQNCKLFPKHIVFMRTNWDSLSGDVSLQNRGVFVLRDGQCPVFTVVKFL